MALEIVYVNTYAQTLNLAVTNPVFPPFVHNAVIITPADIVSLDIRQRQGLVDSEIAASATNHIKDSSGVNELEAVAESVPFANHRKNDHRSGGKHEVQLQNLAQGHFKGQHRCDPGFAAVSGMTLQPTARPRINRDIDLKFEPGMAAGLDRVRIHRAEALLHFLKRVSMGMAFSMPIS